MRQVRSLAGTRLPRLPYLLPLLLCMTCPAQARESFSVASATGEYALQIDMESCAGDALHGPGSCGGPARVTLRLARAGLPPQAIDLPNIELRRAALLRDAQWGGAPTIGIDAQYTVVVEDFNADRWPDIAIATGQNGEYGSLSYTVFLFDKRSGRFVESPAFSALTVGASGVRVDHAAGLIAVTRKNDGPHEDKVYKVEYNRPVLVESTTEAVGARTVRGRRMLEFKTTRRQFLNGQWQTTVERAYEDR